jgi:hypothetical protein
MPMPSPEPIASLDHAANRSSMRPRSDGPVVVVSNARAGLARRSPELARSLSRSVGARGRVEVTRDLDDLDAVVLRAKEEGASLLVSCGGDGSHMRLLSCVSRRYGAAAWPTLCMLAGGTMNTAARNLGTARRPDVVLRAVLDGGCPTRSMRLLSVDGRVGFVAGFGFVAALMQRYYETMTGPVATALMAARVLASAVVGGSYTASLFRRIALSASFDGGPPDRVDVSGVLAAVVPVPTLGIRATRRAGEDGRFHVVASGLEPRPLLAEVHRLWLGLPVKALVLDRTAETALLVPDVPVAWTLDGEMFEGRRLNIGLTPPVTLVAG